MPIYYTTRDRAKAESKGHRFEQDYNVFCSSDQEHKPLWQFSYPSPFSSRQIDCLMRFGR